VHQYGRCVRALTGEIYLFRYNKAVPSLSVGRQLADNPEVTEATATSPRLQRRLDQLDDVIEVSDFRFDELFK